MKPWRIAFMMLAAFSLASCSKKDGDWDPMKWRADEPVQLTDGVFNVSADEETFSFTCSNYSQPWFSNSKDNGRDIFPKEGDPKSIDSDSFSAKIQGNKLIIDFKENESDQKRCFSITVTAGDIFHTFNFEQAANPVWQSTCEVYYAIYAIDDNLLQFYDITAEYLGLDGQMHTEVITDKKWYYVPDLLSIADTPEEFKCRIVAVRKNDLPELTEDYYRIGWGVDVHVAFLNASGEVVFKAKQPQFSSFSWTTDKTGMQQFLENTQEIEIATCSPTISKAEMIEKLK